MSKVIELTLDGFNTEINSDKPVLVDFWAPCCGPCKMIAPIMEQLADQYKKKVKICKVNVDEQGELAEQFGIQSIPSIIIFKEGKMVDKFIGAKPKEEFERIIDRIL